MSGLVTLARRGFTLPEAVTRTGHSVFDKLQCWHTLALTKAVRDFLRPDLEADTVCGHGRKRAAAILDAAATDDGFRSTRYSGRGISCDFRDCVWSIDARENIAAWIGVAPDIIWPHHRLGSAIVLSRQPAWAGAAASHRPASFWGQHWLTALLGLERWGWGRFA